MKLNKLIVGILIIFAFIFLYVGCPNYSYKNTGIGGYAIGTAEDLYIFLFVGKTQILNNINVGHAAFRTIGSIIYLVHINKNGDNDGRIISIPNNKLNLSDSAIIYDEGDFYLINRTDNVYFLENDQFRRVHNEKQIIYAITRDIHIDTIFLNKKIVNHFNLNHGAILSTKLQGILTFNYKFTWDDQDVLINQLPGPEMMKDSDYNDVLIEITPLLNTPIKIEIPKDYIPVSFQKSEPIFSEIKYSPGIK